MKFLFPARWGHSPQDLLFWFSATLSGKQPSSILFSIWLSYHFFLALSKNQDGCLPDRDGEIRECTKPRSGLIGPTLGFPFDWLQGLLNRNGLVQIDDILLWVFSDGEHTSWVGSLSTQHHTQMFNYATVWLSINVGKSQKEGCRNETWNPHRWACTWVTTWSHLRQHKVAMLVIGREKTCTI